MTKDAALKLALEALESLFNGQVDQDRAKHCSDAITAIREALAQPQQEPFEYWSAVEGWVKIGEVRQHFDSVGCGTIYKTAGEDRVPLYTSPPARKPLTNKEIAELYMSHTDRPMKAHWEFARAIEAAHGIKEDRNEA